MSSQVSYQVRALERALDILGKFSVREPELSLAEISAQTGIAKSTTFRLISVLTDYGYLERVADSERYRIGIRAFETGSIYIQSTSIEAEARPFLAKLAEECQQTANLGVLNDAEIVHIAVVPPNRPIRYYASVGDREKAYCTGLGKALISEFSDAQLTEFIAKQPLVRRTEKTVTSPDALRAQLGEIRAQGYAVDDEESIDGLRCVAAPIRNANGGLVAAVSVSGPAGEYGPSEMSRYVDAIKLVAHSISTRLGYAAN